MKTMQHANIGLLGAGFVSNLYMQSLRNIRDHDVITVFSLNESKAQAFSHKWGIPECTSSMDEVIEHSDVDLVIVGVPHHLHVEVIEKIARAGKAVICTKPLGRNGEEARRCLDAVEKAGVWHGYAETEVFSPSSMRAKEMIDSGALGKVYWVRFREAHSQIHPFARKPELNGGGPLRGLGCHGVAIGRWYLSGRSPVEVFAWGDRLARDDVQAEDSAILLIRFDDGSLAQVEVGWGHKPGLDIRGEVHGTKGFISTNITGETGIRAYTLEPAGYVVEKASMDHGWMSPVPREYITYGFHSELDHLIHAYLANETPWQTFHDGLVDNAIIDTAYRSMKSGKWEKLVIPGGAL